MNKKIIGAVLIVVGAGLALWGYDVYDAAGARISRALTGDTPIEAWLGMGGGAICIILGVLRLR